MKKQTLAAVILTGAMSLLSFNALAYYNYDADTPQKTTTPAGKVVKGTVGHQTDSGNPDAYIAP